MGERKRFRQRLTANRTLALSHERHASRKRLALIAPLRSRRLLPHVLSIEVSPWPSCRRPPFPRPTDARPVCPQDLGLIVAFRSKPAGRSPLMAGTCVKKLIGFVRRIRDRPLCLHPSSGRVVPRETSSPVDRPRPEIRHRIDREHQEREAPTIRLRLFWRILGLSHGFLTFWHHYDQARHLASAALHSLGTNVRAWAAALIAPNHGEEPGETRKSMQPQRAQSTQREKHGGSRGREARARCDRRVRGRAGPGRVP